MSVAAKVAQAKSEHPGEFCSHTRCLWRTGGGDCPRHRREEESEAEEMRRTR